MLCVCRASVWYRVCKLVSLFIYQRYGGAQHFQKWYVNVERRRHQASSTMLWYNTIICYRFTWDMKHCACGIGTHFCINYSAGLIVCVENGRTEHERTIDWVPIKDKSISIYYSRDFNCIYCEKNKLHIYFFVPMRWLFFRPFYSHQPNRNQVDTHSVCSDKRITNNDIKWRLSQCFLNANLIYRFHWMRAFDLRGKKRNQ